MDTATPDTTALLDEIKKLRTQNQILERERSQYGLSFKRIPEQGEAQKLRNGEIPFLSRRPEFSTVKDTPQRGEHVLIEGDNISALVTLQATHKGKVDVIYIDPPYNTGNKDFVYNDSYVSNEDGFRHSKWLAFMERRLYLAKELLSETGVIFVSIDDNEQAALKMLMDKVFGVGNFVANMIWKSKSGGAPDANGIATTTEYVLSYCKNVVAAKINKESSLDLEKYKLSDEHLVARGPYQLNKLDRRMQKGHYSDSLNYPIAMPDGTRLYPGGLATRSEGWNWRWSKDKVRWGVENDFLVFKKNGKGWAIYFKQYAYVDNKNERIKRTKAYENLIPDSFKTVTGNREVAAILGHQVFDYPKPVGMIQYITSIAGNPNAVVLDFFAGSGTTGHAVAALNAEDGGNRQAILVTNNFEQDGSPNGIARDVTAARMKAVLTGKWADGKAHDPLPGNLHYYQIEFAPDESPSGAASSWSKNQRILGLIALEHSAFELPHLTSRIPEGTLKGLVDEGRAKLLFNEESMFAFWLDKNVTDSADEDVETFAEEAHALAEELGLKVRFYIPSHDPTYIPDEDFYELDGAQATTYPLTHIGEMQKAVKTMKASGRLGGLDKLPEDAEGNEGIPVEQEADDTPDTDL